MPGAAGNGKREKQLPGYRVSSGVRGIFWNCVEVVVYNIVDMLKATSHFKSVNFM